MVKGIVARGWREIASIATLLLRSKGHAVSALDLILPPPLFFLNLSSKLRRFVTDVFQNILQFSFPSQIRYDWYLKLNSKAQTRFM
jgi:hypothetical protein